MIYAQLNEENICVGVSQLSREVDSPLLIPIAEFDSSVIGKKYNNGAWEEVEQPEITPEPTQLDKLEENQLALMEAVADQYEEQIENRINNMEVQASIYEEILKLGGGE